MPGRFNHAAHQAILAQIIGIFQATEYFLSDRSYVPTAKDMLYVAEMQRVLFEVEGGDGDVADVVFDAYVLRSSVQYVV